MSHNKEEKNKTHSAGQYRRPGNLERSLLSFSPALSTRIPKPSVSRQFRVGFGVGDSANEWFTQYPFTTSALLNRTLSFLG